ncbi:MAG: exported protein of unknown function, partial [Candidatus Saccharibacteria bacterium]|nr:exported protein of unknown function [Candidatus Saccharibacteria bacterium]
MHKQTSLLRRLSLCTLRWLSVRVFFAVRSLARCKHLTPVIFYTRAYAHARVRAIARTGGVDLSKFRRAIAATAIAAALVITLGLSLINPLPAVAAGSENLNFQARLEGLNGAIANDGDYNVEFKLYSVATGGTALWTETRTGADKVRVVNGYLTVNLGDVNSFPSTIAWDQDMYVTMNIGGTGSPTWDGEMNPRLKLTAVPYAFQAKSATQLQVSNGANVGTLSFTTPTTTRNILLPDASGTVCLDVSVNNCNYASASGSSAYIQNGTGLQGNANFNIQSVGAGAITAKIQAFTGQTADLLRFENSAGTTALSGFNSSGQLYYQSGSFVGTIVQDTLTTASTNYHLPDTGSANETICTVSTCTGG